MRRSKLEMYIDILREIHINGPMKLTHIMYKCNINCSILKEYLNFLIDPQKLIEEKLVGKRTVYDITKQGIIVLKTFSELKLKLPIVEETRKSQPVKISWENNTRENRQK